MKTLISRIMPNCTYNRIGVFNAPMDHVALGPSEDYTTIIQQPMDLGTINARVHANSYRTQEEVAMDIRLVFQNALLYNPPNHPVHIVANNLLQIFEDGYTSIVNRNLEEDQKILRRPHVFASSLIVIEHSMYTCTRHVYTFFIWF